jgi:glycosyltransferase involved in cell wall biosynthesis
MSLCHPLTIFVPHCSNLLTDHRAHGDGLISHALISRLAERGHHLYVAASQTDLQKPLPPNAHLFNLVHRDVKGIASRLRYMWRVRQLFQSLEKKQVRFDLIHQLNPVFSGVSLALFNSHVPLVLGHFFGRWPNDPTAASPPRHRWQSSLRESGRTLTTFLQQSSADCLLPATNSALRQLTLPRRAKPRIEILPLGIDSTTFCPLADSEVLLANDGVSGPATILFHAHVLRRKGIFDLLQAFDRVVERYPRSQLTISGTGPQLAEAQSIALSMRGRTQVRFVGLQDRTGTITQYQSADIYCLPSHGEPYGLSAVEAMSCGKPLVVTDAGGLGGLVDDQGGLRVPVADPERLADALCALVTNPARRKAMGEHNRRRVLETMTWDRVIDRLEEIYLLTLEDKHRAGQKRQTGASVLAQSPGDCA